jgi:hypothetical protein
MKQFALALAIVLAASSPLLAKDRVKQPKTAPAATTQMVKPAQRPVLDPFKTQSIAPASNEAAKNAPAPRRERSGIEINPWIVPNFL